jgi:diadenosine tetraphosphate (Ap4A) HIT family hydrolase
MSVLEAFPTFPFEMPVRMRPIKTAEDELIRRGSAPELCDECQAPDDEYLWADRSWRLRLRRPSALPGLVTLHTREHYDSFADLPESLAMNFGLLVGRIEHAVQSVGNVGRVHMIKSGDGHAHFHVWFYPRPLRMTQFRGSLLPLWALLLESATEEEVEQAGNKIVSALEARST